MDETGFASEAELARLRRPDDAGARELLHRFYPLVRKLVRSHLPRRTSEEDLCQTIFMKIFANLETYSGKVPVEHWVSRIAVNTCLNALQAEKIRPELRWADLPVEEAEVLQSLAATEEDLHPAKNLASREIVEKLLAELNPRDRLVINLLHLEGRSIQEIAQMTGWNATLVKVRAFRARQKLKSAFHKLTEEGQL